jgi:hypothetical protein
MTSSARVSSSFRSTVATWCSAVRAEIASRSAISLFVRPSASSKDTSSSRRVGAGRLVAGTDYPLKVGGIFHQGRGHLAGHGWLQGHRDGAGGVLDDEHDRGTRVYLARDGELGLLAGQQLEEGAEVRIAQLVVYPDDQANGRRTVPPATAAHGVIVVPHLTRLPAAVRAFKDTGLRVGEKVPGKVPAVLPLRSDRPVSLRFAHCFTSQTFSRDAEGMGIGFWRSFLDGEAAPPHGIGGRIAVVSRSAGPYPRSRRLAVCTSLGLAVRTRLVFAKAAHRAAGTPLRTPCGPCSATTAFPSWARVFTLRVELRACVVAQRVAAVQAAAKGGRPAFRAEGKGRVAGGGGPSIRARRQRMFAGTVRRQTSRQPPTTLVALADNRRQTTLRSRLLAVAGGVLRPRQQRPSFHYAEAHCRPPGRSFGPAARVSRTT